MYRVHSSGIAQHFDFTPDIPNMAQARTKAREKAMQTLEMAGDKFGIDYVYMRENFTRDGYEICAHAGGLLYQVTIGKEINDV